jgi:hypothetical protein
VPYAIRPLDELEAEDVASWTASAALVDGAIVVSFENAYCPVCKHNAAPPSWRPRRIEQGSLGLRPQPETRTREQIVVRCACREGHVDRPMTEPFGCGGVWSVKFAWDGAPSVGDVAPGPLPSPQDLTLESRLAEIEANELARVRAQAQGWAKAMAALAALAGASQVFAGRSFADELAAPWRDAIGIALVVAVVAAAASSIAAGLAGYGWPGSIQLTGTGEVGGPAARLQTEIKKLVARTRPPLAAAAATAAVAFFAALFVGIALWWAPRAPPAELAPVCVRGPAGEVTQLAELPQVTAGSLLVVKCDS